MRRTSDGRESFRLRRYELEAPCVARIDRETLEGVMREDVFLVADGKALALDAIDLLAQARPGGRRA